MKNLSAFFLSFPFRSSRSIVFQFPLVVRSLRLLFSRERREETKDLDLSPFFVFVLVKKEIPLSKFDYRGFNGPNYKFIIVPINETS